MDNGSQCKITVDGVDFPIMEPKPFDPKWMSEKFNGPGVKYEIAVNIQNGWIVHVNGPFPCGQWHDLTVARQNLCYKLAVSEDPEELALADGGYQDGYQFFETPTGHNNEDQRMKAKARARHETVNRRIKQWGVMGERFRADPNEHWKYFNAVANLTQFIIMDSGYVPLECERKFFNVRYNDHGGKNPSTNHIPMIGDDNDEE
jgi:DDE superfamily endonuclease